MNPTEYRLFSTNPIQFLSSDNYNLRFNLPHPKGASVHRQTHYTGTKLPVTFYHSESLLSTVHLYTERPVYQPNPVLWINSKSGGVAGKTERAYYLHWQPDSAYAVMVGSNAKFFFTAELTGCGLLLYDCPAGILAVHLNMDVDICVKKRFESQSKYLSRDSANRFKVKNAEFSTLADRIEEDYPELQGGARFLPHHYQSQGSGKAHVFGVNNDNVWTFYYSVGDLYGIFYRQGSH